MAAIRHKDTQPELIVRKIAHRLGYRFRIHRRDLPGRPDLVFPRYGLALFVHGCFWHRHEGCKRTTTPKANHDFWQAKFAANIERDSRKSNELESLGWRVCIVWECQTSDPQLIESILVEQMPRLAS
jgi:DNA mismatch endonuclease, patch repair protein